MNRDKGKLFVFSAPSGSGKTTIVKYVLSTFSDFIFSISATTRKKRGTEVDNKDYFFISEDDFKKKADAGEFVEWDFHFDYYYGTLRSFVEEHLDKGDSIVFELDVKGAVNIKKEYPEAVLIFVSPPNIEELRKRLILRRTESEEQLKKRIERAEMELGYKDEFDFVVDNGDLDSAKIETKKIIERILQQEK